MCGLNFVASRARYLVEGMNQAIKHRGLSSGVLEGPYFTMGHVRLPIVGLSHEFNQPYRRNGWTFLFVGEIVNFKELDPEAESDVQVLADLWAEEGPSCVRKFDGFWSIVAVADLMPHVAHIVTDFLAKKPLYIRQEGDLVAVSSEIRALTLEAFPRVIKDTAYFSSVRKWGYHMGSRTWAWQVRKIPPGAYVRIERNPFETKVSVDERFDEVTPQKNVDLRQSLVDAIRRRVLASDVPLSLLVSGGLDSSIIYQVARGLTDNLVLYHVDNDEAEFLEMLNPTHEVRKISFEDQDLDDVLRANEGPVDLGSMLQQRALGKAVTERVCLSGDGADEVFGGYRRTAIYDSQGSDIYDELVYYHLPRLDKMMMAGTVELRCPFLARDVLAGALGLPYERRVDKVHLRDLFTDILPEPIAHGPKRPLKSSQVVENAVQWRYELCDTFEQMVDAGVVT